MRHQHVSMENLITIISYGHAYFKREDIDGYDYPEGNRGRHYGYSHPNGLRKDLLEIVRDPASAVMLSADKDSMLVYNANKETLIVFNQFDRSGLDAHGYPNRSWDGGTSYKISPADWKRKVNHVKNDYPGSNGPNPKFGEAAIALARQFMDELESNTAAMGSYRTKASLFRLPEAEKRINEAPELKEIEIQIPFPSQKDMAIKDAVLYEAMRNLPVAVPEAVAAHLPESHLTALEVRTEIDVEFAALLHTRDALTNNIIDITIQPELVREKQSLEQQKKRLIENMSYDSGSARRAGIQINQIEKLIEDSEESLKANVRDYVSYIRQARQEASIVETIRDYAELLEDALSDPKIMKHPALVQKTGTDDVPVSASAGFAATHGNGDHSTIQAAQLITAAVNSAGALLSSNPAEPAQASEISATSKKKL